MNAAAFYERLQTDLIAWASDIPDIRLILVVGSQVRLIKPADEYSDLDVSLYVTGDLEAQSAAYLAWIRSFAPVWMILDEHHDAAKSWLILFQGAIKVDFAVVPLSEIHALIDAGQLWDDQQRGYRVLMDKDGLAERLPAPKPFDPPPYTPPTQEQFTRRVEAYFYGAAYVAKQIKRGNLWKVKWADQIQQRMMLEMLEWHAHATHDAPIDTYYRGDFMRDWVSAQTWNDLHGVFAHFDARDSRTALNEAIRLFTQLTRESAAKLGHSYPQQMMHEVTQYIEQLNAD